MTNASEVVVSDVEMLQAIVTYKETGNMRQALAAFLAKRVPVRLDVPVTTGKSAKANHLMGAAQGFNACRERVLRGE